MTVDARMARAEHPRDDAQRLAAVRPGLGPARLPRPQLGECGQGVGDTQVVCAETLLQDRESLLGERLRLARITERDCGLRQEVERRGALGMLRIEAPGLETERLTVERGGLGRAPLEPSQPPERVLTLSDQRVLAVAGALADGEGLLEMGLSLGELVFEDQELGGTTVTLGHGQVRLAYRLLPHGRAALDGTTGDSAEPVQHSVVSEHCHPL